MSELVNRKKRDETFFCAGCWQACGHPPMRCSRCKFVRYCSQECQRANFGMHKAVCKQIAKTKQEIEQQGGDYRLMFALGMLMFCEVSVIFGGKKIMNTECLIKGKYLYEQALDLYVRVYEKVNLLDGIPDKESKQDWFRRRIAVLLAVLGDDDDLTVRAIHNFMLRRCRQADGLVDRSSDLIKLGCCCYNCVNPKDWPRYYLLSLFLVKLRLVSETTAKREQYDALMETKTGQYLLTAAPALKDAIVYEPTKNYLSNQQDQLQLLFELASEKDQDGINFFQFLDEFHKGRVQAPAVIDKNCPISLVLAENRLLLDCFFHPAIYKVVQQLYNNQTPRNLDLYRRSLMVADESRTEHDGGKDAKVPDTATSSARDSGGADYL